MGSVGFAVELRRIRHLEPVTKGRCLQTAHRNRFMGSTITCGSGAGSPSFAAARGLS